VAWSDTVKTRQVALVSDRLARQLAPGGDVIGRRVRFGADPRNQDVEIVGVVANMTMGNSRQTDLPVLFRPALQLPQFGLYPSLVIRHHPDALATLTAELRRIAAGGGREFLLDVERLPVLFERAPASERMSASVAVTMAALATVLAFVGVFAALAYSVTRRTREIGIRGALGADPAALTWMVVREGLLLAAVGVAIGLPAAYAGGRLLDTLIFGVSRADPITFAVASFLFLLLGAGASMWPARRAARIDPVIALRAE
jgi:hypothetical protein